MADNFALQLQKLANSTQVKLQELSNQATAKTLSYNAKEAYKTRKYNAEEAATSRRWQTNMSNTAHQREVKDLVKAGLNPVLSSNQGAQSYTTSSASAQNASGQAENPSNAIAAITGAQMSGMSNIHSSKISAAATKQAAAAAAAAQRYAAAQSAAAQIYAANRHYETEQMAAKWRYKTARYQTDHSKSGSAAGIIDNYINRATSNSATLSDIKQRHRTAADIRDNPDRFVLNKSVGLTFNNLNWRGKQFLQSYLRKYNIDSRMQNQQLAFNALILQRESAAKALGRMISDQLRYEEERKKRYSKFSRYAF